MLLGSLNTVLNDKHCVAVGVESVFLVDGVFVGF
jgi:hypothetical protein